MPSPQDGNWSKEDEEASIKRGVSKSSPQNIHVNALNILVTKALLKCGGQPIIPGWTAMVTSFHRGWLVCEQRARSVAMPFFLSTALKPHARDTWEQNCSYPGSV